MLAYKDDRYAQWVDCSLDIGQELDRYGLPPKPRKPKILRPEPDGGTAGLPEETWRDDETLTAFGVGRCRSGKRCGRPRRRRTRKSSRT